MGNPGLCCWRDGLKRARVQVFILCVVSAVPGVAWAQDAVAHGGATSTTGWSAFGLAVLGLMTAAIRGWFSLMRKREQRTAPVPRHEFDELKGTVSAMGEQIIQLGERQDSLQQANATALADHRVKTAEQLLEHRHALEQKYDDGKREIIEAVAELLKGKTG